MATLIGAPERPEESKNTPCVPRLRITPHLRAYQRVGVCDMLILHASARLTLLVEAANANKPMAQHQQRSRDGYRVQLFGTALKGNPHLYPIRSGVTADWTRDGAACMMLWLTLEQAPMRRFPVVERLPKAFRLLHLARSLLQNCFPIRFPQCM
mmetsp:Transcript_74511/g.224008  ORF Transcript_74511/g.224008 Transcript_74511/m.224008 type:complete len:154 (+) Transcript_74511:189-650(+)